MKKTVALLIAALIAAPLSLGPAESAIASTCTLSGAGTVGDPWLVNSASDFQLIGDSPCLLSGYYKQTAPITLTTATSDELPNGFSGSYDGDFYTLTLAGTWSDGSASVSGVFGSNITGTIKKLHLAGNYKPSSVLNQGSPLAFAIQAGGIVSQVRSTVNVTITGNADTVKLSGLVSRLGRGALMEYSSASGVLSWEPSGTPGPYQYYGGLVVDVSTDETGLGLTAGSTRTVEIRDSYSTVTVKWPSAARCKAYFGGIAGSTSQLGSDAYLVRTYSASKLDPSTDTTRCGFFPAIGGLLGRSDNGRLLGTGVPSYVYLISSFWAQDLIGDVSYSTGLPQRAGSYENSLPRAVGLTSEYLKTISTFQSKESATAGIPDTSSNLAIGSSTGGYTTDGTLTTNEETFRWAIESGNVLAFVPPTYPTAQSTPPTTAFFNRTVISDTTVSASMAGRGQVALEGPVTGYPTLGRVWEICAGSNSGFPVLVWEERDCTGEGEGGGGSSGGGAEGGSASGGSSAEPALAATGPSTIATVALAGTAGALLVGGTLLVRRSRQVLAGK